MNPDRIEQAERLRLDARIDGLFARLDELERAVKRLGGTADTILEKLDALSR